MSDNAREKGSSTRIILIVGIVLVLIAVAAVGILVVNTLKARQTSEPVSSAPVQAAFGGGNVVVDDGNAASLAEEMQRKADEGMFSCRMNMDWSFPDGTSPSANAFVANSTSNRSPIYFTLMLDGTEEVLYTSPKIPVGSSVEEIALDRDLDPGSYDCVCTYYILNDDDTVKTTTKIAVRVTVDA